MMQKVMKTENRQVYWEYGMMFMLGGLLVLVIVGIFWLQGFLWYGIVKFFKARNQIEGQ